MDLPFAVSPPQKALTKDEFDQRISKFYTFQTGVGLNIMLMSVMSFIVGLSISGQTFYTFVLENIDKFGALKAIGAQGRELVYMILFQALYTGLVGYGLGVGLCALMIEGAQSISSNYAAVITFGNLDPGLAMMLVIAAVSSLIAARKLMSIDPFDIPRERRALIVVEGLYGRRTHRARRRRHHDAPRRRPAA